MQLTTIIKLCINTEITYTIRYTILHFSPDDGASSKTIQKFKPSGLPSVRYLQRRASDIEISTKARIYRVDHECAQQCFCFFIIIIPVLFAPIALRTSFYFFFLHFFSVLCRRRRLLDRVLCCRFAGTAMSKKNFLKSIIIQFIKIKLTRLYIGYIIEWNRSV